MLPENPSAREEYIELRDCRTRWRQMILRKYHGDMGEFQSYVLSSVSRESELASFREVVDFAEAEGMFTPEQMEAANNTVAWGHELLRMLADTKTNPTGSPT